MLVLSTVCAFCGIASTLLTAAIALGFNRHMGRYLQRKYPRHFRCDYGDGDDARRSPY